MLMMPALMMAMQDRSLRGNPREVYLWLCENLDVREFRELKHSAIQTDLRLADSSVYRAIDRLVERGYLDRGPLSGRLRTYRLYYSRRPD